MVEILKQKQYVPMNVEKQVAIIFAASKGHLDDLEINKVASFEAGLFEYLDVNSRNLLDEIVKKGKITDELEEKLDSAIVNFKTGFKAK